MSNKIIYEQAFEDTIVQHLCDQGGYQLGQNEHWSQELAFDRTTLLKFVRDTQPEAWERLSAIHGSDVERRFLQRLLHELDKRGTIDVLRHGVIDYGERFQLAFFKPSHGLNPEVQARYESNRLTVFRQLHHSIRNGRDSIDLVLCLNGLPVATIELKNQFTRGSAADGRQQYIDTRDPREPLFAFKRRALVHFVVDADEVWMTTRLNGRETRFLPFNRVYTAMAKPARVTHSTRMVTAQLIFGTIFLCVMPGCRSSATLYIFNRMKCLLMGACSHVSR